MLLQRFRNRLFPAVDVQFGVDIFQVGAGSIERDKEFGSDHFCAVAFAQELQYFEFAGR